jgi:circadian clock protein KaiC
MTRTQRGATLPSGVRNLDAILGGGVPKGAITVVCGAPGSGKTILAHQICLSLASPRRRVLYFNTLSEPTAKTLRHLRRFSFFDPGTLDLDFQFVDLGLLVRERGLDRTLALIVERLKAVRPAVVVIDSFKSFDDMAASTEDLRKFGYEVAVQMMAWEASAFLLGEYGPDEYLTNPLFSVADGLITLSQRESSGEQQRYLQVVKMRGADHSRDAHSFVITPDGIEVFAPRLTLHREARHDEHATRLRTGIGKLDEMLGEGIPRGSSLLVAGVAGTGKTVLALEFVYRGALAGEMGILFSFEETTERLLATSKGMGWDLERQMAKGLIEMVFIAQPDILVERDLLMMQERVAAFGAVRVAIDSVSVFLHRIRDAQVAREKVFQLASVVQNAGAVGFFSTDIPYGSHQISRFGVEETVVDGVILLSATEEGYERQRYIEVYKLRNTAHMKGRHNLVIGRGGIEVFPRYGEAPPPAPLHVRKRLASGVPGLDALVGGGLLRRSATLLAGSPGVGKSTMGLQFILEGAARRGEPGLIFTLEESPDQVLATADALGLPLRRWVEKRAIEVIYLPHERARAAQFLAILGDRIRGLAARRLLLDGVTHIVRDGDGPDGLRQLLCSLIAQFKALDVTSVLTVESKSLHFGDDVTERGFSPVADNLVMLRYVERDGELTPALRVVKTRGSRHGRGTYSIVRCEDGLAIADASGAKAPPPAKRSAGARRSEPAKRRPRRRSGRA